MNKLSKLAEIEGMDQMEMIEQATFDGLCPGICTNKDCDYTTEVESDQDRGYCEECKTQTVKSALILAGMK